MQTKPIWERENYQLALILIAGSLTTMAGGVVAPVLPDVITQLHLDPVLAGNLVSMHCFTIALFSPILGIIADKISPSRVLIPSLFLYGLFGVAGALMSDFWSLLATRAALGAASGGIAAGSLGLLGQMYEGEERAQAIGYATATLTVTGMLYPLLGGWFGAEKWQFAFYLYAVGILLALVAILLFSSQFYRVSQPKSKSKGIEINLGDLLRNHQILGLLLTLALSSVVMYSVVIYAPIYLKNTLNLSPILNGIVLAVRAVGAAVISAFGTKQIAKKIGGHGAIAVGFGLMALMLITIPVLTDLIWILVAAAFFGVGFGLVVPNLYNNLSNSAPQQLRSSVLAAGTGVGFLGQFISPILLGPILGFAGLESVFYASALVSLVAGLSLVFTFPPKFFQLGKE